MNDEYYSEELSAVPFFTMLSVFREQVPLPLALALAAFFRLRGLLRWPLKPTSAFGPIESAREISPDEIPRWASSPCEPILEQLNGLGFTAIRYTLVDTIGLKAQCTIALLDDPGTTIASLVCTKAGGAEGIVCKFPAEFNSFTRADPEIMTGWLEPAEIAFADVFKIDFVDMSFVSNETPIAAAYRRHCERIKGVSPLTFSADGAVRELARRNLRRMEWTLKQGLIRRLRAREVANVRRLVLE